MPWPLITAPFATSDASRESAPARWMNAPAITWKVLFPSGSAIGAIVSAGRFFSISSSSRAFALVELFVTAISTANPAARALESADAAAARCARSIAGVAAVAAVPAGRGASGGGAGGAAAVLSGTMNESIAPAVPLSGVSTAVAESVTVARWKRPERQRPPPASAITASTPSHAGQLDRRGGGGATARIVLARPRVATFSVSCCGSCSALIVPVTRSMSWPPEPGPRT